MQFDQSPQTIVWFKDRYREGNLIIKPPYQRNPVWVARQKCSLIETILMDLPVPEVYIQQTTTPEGVVSYGVVDGQQRIRTILQFIGVENDPNEQEYNKFVLDKLEPESPWATLSFGDLPPDDKKRFYEYKLAVRFLYTDKEVEVRGMFERLNRYLTPLKAQELRNARYTGPFIQLANELANNEFWAENRLVSPAIIRRMGDIEFVSELLIGTLHGPQGGSSDIVDAYYAQYEDYEDEFPNQKGTTKLFDETLKLIQTLMPDLKATRWSNKTDFYSLFVVFAQMLKTSKLPSRNKSKLIAALKDFAEKVETGFADEEADVGKEVRDYISAVQKGVNDKQRRAARHLILLNVVSPFFSKAKKK